jgi:hypothetical protein
MEKTSHLYVFLALVECHFITTNFGFWISKGAYDVFTLIIIFLGSDWQPKYVTIGLFEEKETIGQAFVKNLTNLLDKCGSRKKLITFVKDEGSNINAIITTLKFVVSCEFLGLEENF